MPDLVRGVEFVSRLLPQPVKLAMYRIPFLSRLIRQQLNRAVPDQLSNVFATGGPLIGLRLRLNLKTEKYYWLGTYEPQLMQAIRDLCRPGMTVYDVGANIGYVSLAFARAVGAGGRVFAFEPLPANVERIRDHVMMNDLASIVTVAPLAVADQEGTASFLVHSAHAMGKLEQSAGRQAEYEKRIEVATIGLDKYCYELRNPIPDLVKMDIEGGGVLAVRGMPRLIAEARPTIFVELHGPDEGHAVWELLIQNRYSMHRMDRNLSRIVDLSQLDWKEHLVGLPQGKTI